MKIIIKLPNKEREDGKREKKINHRGCGGRKR